MDASDTEELVKLVHLCGLRAGADPATSRSDCRFCNDRIEICRAWLAGFSIGRATLSSAYVDTATATADGYLK
jgi:hypothetical protein